MIVLLTAEFAVMAVATVFLVVEIITTHPDSYASGVAFIVLALVATVWLAYMVIGALRGRAWMRGAAIVWQVIQFAIGIGCFQGLTATPAIGWFLVVPAVLVVVLLFTRPVVERTAGRS
ncbi:hypothetical protein [Frondihabitans cladoniiphilus]|uniref:Integral membrane protein n=1 Tax=Frondihabitans cladoniiphilus TaxID=715785 RepID=A0ABP8WCY7_9MICO